jgi:predicted alpha/beta-hydrolase family hydrolase
LLRDPVLGRQMQECDTPSLTIIGTADPHYDVDYLERLALNQRHEILSIQDGDHSLDLAGDLEGSIVALRRVVDAIGEFVEK